MIADDTRLVAYEWTYKSAGGWPVTVPIVYSIEHTNGSAEELLEDAVKEHPDARILTFAEFDEWDRKVTLERPIREVTEETFDEMLNVLPPLKWVDRICEGHGCRVNEFCMSEFDHSTFTEQYARAFVDGKTRYYAATVDYYDESTWIHNRI